MIQIGSSSGREIAWLANKYPEIQCVGTDIYQEVIDFASASYASDNLKFYLASAITINKLIGCTRKGKTLIFSSGSLQYVQPEHMSSVFRGLSTTQEVEVIVFEPIDVDANLDGSYRSVPRANFSYTHNYKRYAEENGFETQNFRIATPEELHPETASHNRTGHYYWHGIVPV